jgi:acetyl-CoA carboxylase biotin carboxyl carrier protein
MAMNQNEIQELLKSVSDLGITELSIEKKEFKITIKKEATHAAPVYIQSAPAAAAIPTAPAAAPVATAPASADSGASASSTAGDESKYITVKSPMIGTFYRSSGPDKEPFVGVGNDIAPGKTLCIIEAMKLFNEIESEVSGKIVKVLVDDASPVEYDQPLFLVDPA